LASPTKEEYHFLPIVDGWFLPKSVDEVFAAGEQSDVPTLTGLVADEGSYGDDYGKVSAVEFQKRVRQQAGPQAEVILKLYPASTEAGAAESQKSIARDMSMVSMYVWAADRAKTGRTKVYTYLFTHPQPGATEERYQTFHSSELPYVFDNLGQSPRPWTAEDRKIAEILSGYWVNFIATGDPNGKGLPAWPVFDAAREQTMELGDSIGPRPIADRGKFELLRNLWNGPAH